MVAQIGIEFGLSVVPHAAVAHFLGCPLLSALEQGTLEELAQLASLTMTD